MCVWELTLRCNMRCIHCGSAAGKAREDELTVDECLMVADDLLSLGCRQVTFIGGEVFLYRGWERVARRLSEGGALVNIITNGFLLGDAQLEQIRYAQLSNVGISIDGMEANHNRIRDVETSFERVLDALKRLRREEVSIGVVTSLLDFNFYDLEQMYKLFVEQVVSVWQLQIATAMGSMEGNKDLLLDPAKVPEVIKFIKDKRVQGEILVYAGDDIGYYDENELCIRSPPGTLCIWQGCQAGLRAVGIDSVGNVKGCESLYADRFSEGNLRQESLAEIWYGEGRFAYNRQFDVSMLEGVCAGCDRGEVCRGGCRGSSYFTSGALYENIYCCYPDRRTDAA